MPILLLLLLGGAGAAVWYFTQQHPGGAPGAPGAPGSPQPSGGGAPQPGGGGGGSAPAPSGGGGGGNIPSADGPPPGVPVPPFDLSYPGSGAWQSNATYIKAYQSALTFLAWATGNSSFNPQGVDGRYGTNTKNAVSAFERAHGLTVDGECGSSCAQALQTAVTQAATAQNMTAGIHTGSLPPPACGTWAAIGPGVTGVSPILRAQILASIPALSVHPQLPPVGSTFTAPAGNVLVAWYNAAGMPVPVAYCAIGKSPHAPN